MRHAERSTSEFDQEIAQDDTKSETAIPQKKPVTVRHAETSTSELGIHYFRGWRNTLSAHHPCPIKIENIDFKSQEHAYCYKKLMFHNKRKEADIVKKTKHAGKAKSYIRKVLPKPSEEWEKEKGAVMRNIVIKRAQQSEKFRNALLATGNKHLVLGIWQ